MNPRSNGQDWVFLRVWANLEKIEGGRSVWTVAGFKRSRGDVEKRVAGDRFEGNVVDVSDALSAFVCRFYCLNNCCGLLGELV